MNLSGIEYELNKMRAESLGDTGKKLEQLNVMLSREHALLNRRKAISSRIETMLASKLCRKKRNGLSKLNEKLKTKMLKSAKLIEQMQNKKQQLYKDVIIQREALGLTEHSWIDKYYMQENK